MLAKFVLPQGIIWFYIIAIGISATLAQVYMTKAYGETKAGIVGSVSYSNIVFSIILGLFIGDALPNISTTFGIVLIILAGVMVSRAK